jgi:hypothetical protein
MFNKKPFDRINGEDRVCNICSTPFHAIRPINFCPKCATKKQTQIRLRKLEQGLIERKIGYPYTSVSPAGRKEYNARFKKLQSILFKKKTRKEWKEYLKERLDEVLNDEVLMKWINDRRDNESKKEKVIKTNNKTNKEYPDTRGNYE